MLHVIMKGRVGEKLEKRNLDLLTSSFAREDTDPDSLQSKVPERIENFWGKTDM